MKRLRYVVLAGAVLLWLLAGATTGHRARAQTAGWTWSQKQVSGPPARAGASMAYEAARGVTVLFEWGAGCDDYCSDTWTWDGTQWSKHPVSGGPSGRLGASMTFDAVRGVTVLFGGTPCLGSDCGDTWTWDGRLWSRQQASGPPAREYASMAYDAARGVTVLFGGYGCGHIQPFFCGDTWTWDGRQWSQQQVSGPPARSSASMAYDAARGLTVLFGGAGCGGAFGSDCGDTWTWDGGRWSQQGSGPSERKGASMSYDAARGVTVLFGGYGIGCGGRDRRTCSDTWTWDGMQWSQEQVSGPPGRQYASMAYDAVRGVTVLFGGTGSDQVFSAYGDTWTLVGAPAAADPAAASPAPASPPGAPYGIQAAALGPDSIRLDWQSGGGESSFAIYDVATATVVKTVPAGTTTLTLRGLAAGADYCVVIYAVNGAGYSDPSEQVCATTLP